MRTFTVNRFALLSVLALGACHGAGDPAEAGIQGSTPDAVSSRGIVVRGVAAPSSAVSDGTSVSGDDGRVIFGGSDIRSFNSVTREIVFEGAEPAEAITPYEAVAFELDGETLFTAVTAVMPTSSHLICDLVLYIERAEGYRYFLNDGYPAWAGQTEEGLANAAARAEGWNRFLQYVRSENKLIESDDAGNGPCGPAAPGADTGDIELTVFTPTDTWEWVDMEPDRLSVVRSEYELKALVTEESYSPSAIDFDGNTMLLVRVFAPYGLHRLRYGLSETEAGYDYYVRVEMNEACVITDEIFAVLAPVIPETAEVSFEMEITHEVSE